ncbi:cytokinin riboside 5'-monophosphate phosphoribohydrolase [Candidatus Phycosocius bacilliformis]|uniref:Cytokinin riboside 5'-monophosphate phosphoribohydrolase n=1 Tax=Candidatus Phycosocius bacilliformis TaxID=1445552 RepID=A0A2P2EBH0_9PROT|nr:TIGR00730 family Rossman fold protein [Candidatus Phycosocius bacilliformis]GBF58417.1 cytokinin riboside 5'-monophosphate phosphoribohydrolase [Candidatus Phycosocius bacilliformis]
MSKLTSVCVYCGASSQVDPAYLDLATRTGQAIAARGIRLVYGGGNVGLMGASSRAAKAAGGEVLGIMPHFLTKWEKPNPAIETRMVDTMHERKWGLFAESDAFIVLPGGIGTLEEVVETLSWQRLELHQKPVVLIDRAFWQPFIDFIEGTIESKFTPEAFRQSFFTAETPEEALDGLQAACAAS